MMKLGNKLQFGVTALQAGQKSSTVNADPRLIVNSTPGKFVITAPVSKAMGIAVGENVQIGNNIPNIEAAIQQQVPELVQWATENGVDLSTREGADACIKEYTVWFIVKGIPQFDGKGNPVMASERYTKEDKQKFIAANLAKLVEENRAALIERNGGEDADDETLGALINVDDIESPKYHSNTGSKTATTGSATGVGCQLNFTDTAIWNALKADLGENKEKKNRVFSVLLEEAFPAQIFNGKDYVDVTAYPLEFVADEDPIIREKKA